MKLITQVICARKLQITPSNLFILCEDNYSASRVLKQEKFLHKIQIFFLQFTVFKISWALMSHEYKQEKIYP